MNIRDTDGTLYFHGNPADVSGPPRALGKIKEAAKNLMWVSRSSPLKARVAGGDGKKLPAA